MARGHSLDFMKQVYVNRKAGWTPEAVLKLTDSIKNQMKNGSGYEWNAKKAAKACGMSVFGCTTMMKELQKAAEKGMTVEQYFAKGRPFRAGKKVLA